MKKLFKKFIRFILNPTSGFFFYLMCIILYLFVPQGGGEKIALIFLFPFVLIALIGLNLPFFLALFRRFSMSTNKKKNHALEHGTIYFLKKKFGNKLRVGGLAEKNGFRIYGVPKKKEITKAFETFVKEMNKKNTELFVSLKCGSNIVTAQGFGFVLLTLSAIALRLLGVSDLIMALTLLANVLFYFLLRKGLGSWVQEKFFMSTEFTNAKIHSINKVKKNLFWETNPVYFVKTIIE